MSDQIQEVPAPAPVVEQVTTPVVQNPYDAQLAEMKMLIQQQQQEIANLHSRVQQPVTQQVEVPPTDFYSDPQKAIRQQVDSAIAPVNAFIQSFQRTQVYQSNKAQLRNNFPQLQNIWNVIESQLDAIFGNGQVDPTPQNLMMAVNNVVGQLTMRGQNLPASPVPVIPPSIPAAPPVAPVPTQQSTVRLTEQQKIIARASGLTEEDFARRLGQPTIIEV